jgi:hypothetical protein
VWVRRVITLTVALALCGLLAATAGARRDDLQPEARSPADGVAIAGIDVVFTCPDYHPSAYDTMVNRDGDGYHVMLARAGDLGPDGLLLAPNRIDIRDAIVVDGKPGMCTAAPDDSERGLLPTEPGRYWWQPYRDCETYLCPFAVEFGDPSSVVVGKTVCTVTRGALATARRELTAARAALRHRRTAGRRARVATLDARVVTLKSRLSVVYHCKL